MDRLEKRRLASQDLRYAQTLLRHHLGWTFGFPLTLSLSPQTMVDSASKSAVGWFRLDSLHSTNKQHNFFVDHEIIRLSEFAATKLRHSSSSIRRSLFDDFDNWFDRLEHLLTDLKLHLQSKQCLSISKEAGSANDELRRILNAIRDAERLKPQCDEVDVDRWISQNESNLHKNYRKTTLSSSLHRSGLRRCDWEIVVLSNLRSSIRSPDQLYAIHALLNDSAFQSLNVAAPNQSIKQYAEEGKHLLNLHRNQRDRPPKPSNTRSTDTLSGSLLLCLEQLILLPAKSQRPVLETIERINSTRLQRLATETLEMLTREKRRLNELIEPLEVLVASNALRYKHTTKVLRDALEPQLLEESFIEPLQLIDSLIKSMASSKLHQAYLEEISKLLATCAECLEPALKVIDKLVASIAESNDPQQLPSAPPLVIFKGLNRLARRVGSIPKLVDLLQPRKLSDKPNSEYFLLDDWLPHFIRYADGSSRVFAPDYPMENLDRMFRLLEIILQCDHEVVHCKEYKALPIIAVSSLPLEWGYELIKHIYKSDSDLALSEEMIDSILPFASNPSELCIFIDRLTEGKVEPESCRRLTVLAKSQLGKRLVRNWLLHRNWRAIKQIACLMRLSKADNRQLDLDATTCTSDEWINQYPDRLHDSLRILATTTSSADTIAKHLLEPVFPDKDELQREVGYLRQRLSAHNDSPEQQRILSARLKNLEARIHQPLRPSTARLDKLCEKLEIRALLEFEHQIRQTLVQRTIDSLPMQLQDAIQSRLHDETFCKVIQAVDELHPKQRAWGMELIRLSLCGGIFPEKMYEGNVKFLQHLESLGVQTQAWMDIDVRRNYKSEHGRDVTIAFARDPMDYLLMGHHFSTCLSPDSFNFYSTISNAIDINKRVVYGYDTRGKMIGRCLIALSSEGDIVRYAAYSHRNDQQFESALEQFIDQLAIEMQTKRSVAGTVPKLIANDWYDDGAVGQTKHSKEDRLCHEFSELLLQSSKLQYPTEVDQIQIAQKTVEFVKQVEQTRLIDVMRSLPSSWLDAQCVAALCSIDLKVAIRLQLAECLFEKRQFQLSRAVLNCISLKDYQRIFHQSQCDNRYCFFFHGIGGTNFVKFLIETLDPSVALRLLRSTRKKHIRSDEEETDKARRFMLASCHQRLERTKRASRLREYAKSQTCN